MFSGSAANAVLYPSHAVAVGICASFVSVIGHAWLSPKLEKRFKLYDTCGVHNLHGIPGILAGIFSIIFALGYEPESYGKTLYHIYPYFEGGPMEGDRNREIQALYQLAGMGTALASAIVGGLITGFILQIRILNQVDDPHTAHGDINYYAQSEFNFLSKVRPPEMIIRVLFVHHTSLGSDIHLSAQPQSWDSESVSELSGSFVMRQLIGNGTAAKEFHAIFFIICMMIDVVPLLIIGLSTAAADSLLDQVHLVEEPVAVCDSRNSNNSFIYCNGTLLMAVNFHELYNDSKTFVDMPMKHDPEYVLEKFNVEFGNVTIENIDKALLKAFVDDHFSPAGSEMLPCTPSDWHPQPSKLMAIADPQLREWALKLNAIWLSLCRKIDPAIESYSSRYSLLYLPHIFIMPGGRFREFYYWDAYWIVKGLIACEMYDTTKAMIENLGSIVERYGFVPNGGRVYYLQRSQPPLLAGMLYEYYEVTKDKGFLVKMLPIIEKELLFWQTNRMVNVTVKGVTYMVYRYHTRSNMPRPESFTVDIKKAQSIPDKAQFWQDVASAAESGWDFSTRWFSDSKTIYTVETRNVLPVDLNAFICWNYDILEYLFEHDQVKSEFYREVRAKFRNTVHHVFYNNTAGTWYAVFTHQTSYHLQIDNV
ncbi:unnamed protein product [Heligmosomoides polygyrus]|uniref:Trehalase n=1 Tax=Heligmosomoides polygyrus TaxID=6339 RepID=A0A3P7ZZM5_HELPZ|nr:unnamed protein product [Heligmosomoides polygyrus]